LGTEKITWRVCGKKPKVKKISNRCGGVFCFDQIRVSYQRARRIKQKEKNGEEGAMKSRRTTRRSRAGFQMVKKGIGEKQLWGRSKGLLGTKRGVKKKNQIMGPKEGA